VKTQQELDDEITRLTNALETAQLQVTLLTLKCDPDALAPHRFDQDSREYNRQRCARYGSSPANLSSRWTSPDSIPDKIDHYECEAAILDALVTNGITAWSGDGSSLVTQIATALYRKGFSDGQNKAATVDNGTK
jgi:hypothetical protein